MGATNKTAPLELRAAQATGGLFIFTGQFSALDSAVVTSDTFA